MPERLLIFSPDKLVTDMVLINVKSAPLFAMLPPRALPLFPLSPLPTPPPPPTPLAPPKAPQLANVQFTTATVPFVAHKPPPMASPPLPPSPPVKSLVPPAPPAPPVARLLKNVQFVIEPPLVNTAPPKLMPPAFP